MPDDVRRPRPEGLEPWLVAPALVSLATTGVAAILVPLEVVEIEGSALHVGIVMSGVGAGLLTAPGWSRLAARRSLAGLVAAACLAVAVALAGFCFAREVHVWTALAAVMGAGSAGVFTVAAVVVARAYPVARHDAVFGWLQTLATAGTVAGLAVAGVIHHTLLAIEVALGVCAVLAVGAAVLARRTVPSPPATVAATGAGGAPPRWALPFGLFLALWLAGNLAQAAVGAFYPILMREDFQVPPSTSAYALAVATAVSTLLFVPASRSTGRRGGLPVLRGGLGLRLASLVALLALAVAAPAGEAAAALLLYGAFALSWPPVSVAGAVLAARLGGDAGSGAYNAAGAGAFLVGPVLAGHVAELHGYEAVWLLGLAGVALALLLTPALAAATRGAAAPAEAAR